MSGNQKTAPPPTTGHGGNVSKTLVIAGTALRRLFRDRTNIFFVVISPLLFVFVLGLLFGGIQPLRLGVVVEHPDPLTDRLTDAWQSTGGVEVSYYDDRATAGTDVERGLINGAVVIPDDYPQRVRADQATLQWLARDSDQNAPSLETWVRSVATQEAALLRAAGFAEAEGAGSFLDNLERAESLDLPRVEVAVTATGEPQYPDTLNRFAPIAPSLLLLFIFLTSLTAALAVIQSRRIGVINRMLATPTPTGTVVAGEALSRYSVALTQGLIIMVGSALLFGVDWGDPLGSVAVLLLFCGVGSGAAMLIGALFRNEGPALGASLGVGLGLASIGGVMVPLELLDDTGQMIARFTPHAWGYEAYAELVRHGGGITDIGTELAVLAAYAAALFVLGTWALRRSLRR